MEALILSDACVKHLKQLCHKKEQCLALRIRVTSGGCAGLQYDFSLVSFATNTLTKTDVVSEKEGVYIITDTTSLPYLQGSTVDYQETLMLSQFVVLNPNSDEACSCGASFNLKEP